MDSPIDRTVRINELVDLYGRLLTPHQREVLFLYYSLDLSLGEIAERLEVSRQAVYDSLARGVETLENLEDVLNVRMQAARMRGGLDDCLVLLAGLRQEIQDALDVDRPGECGARVERVLCDLHEIDHRLSDMRDELSTAGGRNHGI